MNTEELSNRLTNIIKGLTNTHPIRIKATLNENIANTNQLTPGLT